MKVAGTVEKMVGTTGIELSLRVLGLLLAWKHKSCTHTHALFNVWEVKDYDCVMTRFGVNQMKLLLFVAALLFAFPINAYDENDLKRFKALNKCPGCELSGAHFTRRDFSYAQRRSH